MVRAWNACAAAIDQWPLQRLMEPPIKVASPTWSDFPERLRTDLDEVGQVEQWPKMEGRQMIMVLAPKKKK